MDVAVGSTKFDLYLELEERPQGFIGRFLYSTDLFDAETILRMIGHLITIIQSALDNPDRILERLDLLTSLELSQFNSWNDTARAIRDVSLNALFEAQVRSTPDATAVESSAWTCSYRELEARATQIGHSLRRLGVSNGDLVAVYVDRSIDLIAAYLGVLKAGAAYMPLDGRQPSSRLNDCLDQASATFLLTEARFLTCFVQPIMPVLLLDQVTDVHTDASPLPAQSGSDRLAYVICTSGTSGKPKAVEITHRALVNVLTAMGKSLDFTSNDSLLAITTVTFDIAALEIFLPLLSGGRVLLADYEATVDPHRLAEVIGQTRPTVMQGTPSTWQMLVDTGWCGLEGLKILVGGEMLPRGLADALLHLAAGVWNVYGPTEATIWSTIHQVQRDNRAVPIGRPIANTTVFVVDSHGNQVPIGVQGELCLGGLGVARGYRGQDALTAQRFQKLAPAVFGECVYRTGDIVRWRSDGELEWLGRSDDQVKIRGHRVEPGEVEAILAAIPGVRNVAVVAVAGSTDTVQLVAHFVGAGTDIAALQIEAVRRLPPYLRPSRFLVHDFLPLNTNGKIDRKQLSSLSLFKHCAPVKERSVFTKTEGRLVEIWKELLGQQEIDTTTDFFALGGHSLLAIRLLGMVEQNFGRRVSFATFLQSPTVTSLADLVNKGPAGLGGAAVTSVPKTIRLNVSQALTLRRLRPARGASKGVVLGMPSFLGHAGGVGVIAANALQDYDIWTFAIETAGSELTRDYYWLDCARIIADRLIAHNGLKPNAILGFSLGGYIGWLVDRVVVAAGGGTTPLINFDGGVLHIHAKEHQKRIASLLPGLEALTGARMLLLHRRRPGKFLIAESSMAEWAKIDIHPETLTYSTLDHLDVILPQAIHASGDALAAFVEGGHFVGAPADAVNFETIGGVLFRLLVDSDPPSIAKIRCYVEGMPLPTDGTVRVVLLFLLIASGEFEIARDYAGRMVADQPDHRAAIYAQVALLSEAGRHGQASALADAWCSNNVSDLAMRQPLYRARLQPMRWNAIEAMMVGSDASLDAALRLGHAAKQ